MAEESQSKLRKLITRALGSPGKEDTLDPSPRPELGQLGVTGDARFAPTIFNASYDPSKKQWVLAHRLDRVQYKDYDRVRFYPTVRDALTACRLPIERANFHFECAYQPAADLAMQELGPHIRNLFKQLAKGGLEFGRQTAEKVWEAKTDVKVSSTQAETGAVDRIYPYIWTVRRFAFFSPDDTDLLIWPGTGEFAGLRQFVSPISDHGRDIPADKLIHFVHEQEFDSNYGVPRTKAAIPFVDLAQGLYNDASLYFNRFAVPTLIGYAPTGMRDAGRDANGNPIQKDNKDWLASQIAKLRNASGLVLSSEMLSDGKTRAWGIEPLEIGERGMYVEYALHLNVMIGASLCVPQMALSTVPSSGTYNLGQAQIDLFTQNEEALLDALRDVVNNELCDDFRIFNFGHNCPPLRLVVEPVSTDVARMFLQALVENLAMGAPLPTVDGEVLAVDWAKLASNYGAPVTKVKPQTQPGMDDPNANAQDPDADGVDERNGQGGFELEDPSAPGDPGDGRSSTGGTLAERTGNQESANGLPGTRGGMEGMAKGESQRARMGLSETSRYVSLSEKVVRELDALWHTGD